MYVVLFPKFCEIISLCGLHILALIPSVPLERGALMITRRTLEGASKWALRAFRRLECRLVLTFVILAVRLTGRGLS
jgi:hypothetical protein